MTDFRKLALQKPTLLTRVTAESRYWSKFNVASITKEVSAVSCIDFSPVAPHNYAITSSTRVSYSLLRRLSRFC